MITIRPEKPEDVAVIHQIHALAFGSEVEANLVDALRRNGKAVIALAAEDNGRVVGHILFSPVIIDDSKRQVQGLGLAPVAVLPERQNEGIGSKLVECGLQICRETGCSFVVVLGHPAYYPRFGFVPASRFGVSSEYTVRDEAFMAIEILPGALDDCAGTAKYSPEFNQL